MSDSVIYLHLPPDSAMPEIAAALTRFIVVVEDEVPAQWQKLASDWMVESGCLFMIAWGRECTTWDDSVDWANIDKYDGDPIPADKLVITTWHNDEPLEEVFWFAKTAAEHGTVELTRTIILHISKANRKDELLGLYNSTDTRE